MNNPFDSKDERDQFLSSLWALHEEISTAVSSPQLEPGHLLRLIALGINHCLVGVAASMADTDSAPAEDPRQLTFSFLNDLDAANKKSKKLSRSGRSNRSGKADG